MLNAVVAELSILKVLSDECLGAKLRVTDNQCILFNSLTYVDIHTYIYTPKLEINITHVLEIAHTPPCYKKYNTYARDTHP